MLCVYPTTAFAGTGDFTPTSAVENTEADGPQLVRVMIETQHPPVSASPPKSVLHSAGIGVMYPDTQPALPPPVAGDWISMGPETDAVPNDIDDDTTCDLTCR